MNQSENIREGGRTAKRKGSYDFYLILATTAVLFIISAISIYGMFYFKLAAVHQMADAVKLAYMERMNNIVSPFLIMLILLLSICVPKRLLPTAWLNRFAVVLLVAAAVTSLALGIKAGLVLVLTAALILQVAVLSMALTGSAVLNFEKKGYWVRVGSCLVHLGLILFILDLLLHRHQPLHLALFWVTTGATVIGMLCCFYADTVAGLIRGKRWSVSGDQ